MGICKYTLTKVKNSRKNIFNVQVKNEYHGRNRRVSYTRLVDLKLGKMTIRLHKYHKVFVSKTVYFGLGAGHIFHSEYKELKLNS